MHVNEEARLEAVQSNSWVSQAILLDEPIEETIARVKPDIVVKGKEFEYEENAEEPALRLYGGRLVFGLSEVSLSSLQLLSNDLALVNEDSIKLPKPYLARYGLSAEMLSEVVGKFSELKVCVVGDLIVDEYVTCEALGMSQEDPTLVVTPTDRRRFLGGAGIVAAHAAELGAKSTLITVVGKDEAGDYATGMLSKYGVEGAEVVDESRPTTLKQRFRAENKLFSE